jgi:hypothetical protein
MRARQPIDRPLRALLDEVQPPHLGPLLHAEHTPHTRSSEGPRPVGHLLTDARWFIFQPAQATQYSGHAYTRVTIAFAFSARTTHERFGTEETPGPGLVAAYDR